MATLAYIMQAFILTTNGYGQAGTGESCKTPKIQKITEKYRGGGMLAARKVALGYEPFEFDCDLSSYDPQVLGLCGFSQQGISYAVNGYFDGDANQKISSSLQMMGEMTTSDPGEWQAGKKSMVKCHVDLTALKLTIGSTVVYDIDLIANTFKFAGVDEMATINNLLAASAQTIPSN